MDNKKIKNNAAIIIALILFFPLGLYWMWKKSNWKKSIKIVISGFFVIIAIALITPTSDPINIESTSVPITTIKEIITSVEKTTELEVTRVVDITNKSTISENTTTKVNHTKSNTSSTTQKITTTKQQVVSSKSTTAKVTTTKSSNNSVTKSSSSKASSTTKTTTKKQQSPEQDYSSASFILNTDSGKFHKPSCHMVKRMNPGNKKSVTYSYQTMISKGYSPCKICFK